MVKIACINFINFPHFLVQGLCCDSLHHRWNVNKRGYPLVEHLGASARQTAHKFNLFLIYGVFVNLSRDLFQALTEIFLRIDCIPILFSRSQSKFVNRSVKRVPKLIKRSSCCNVLHCQKWIYFSKKQISVIKGTNQASCRQLELPYFALIHRVVFKDAIIIYRFHIIKGAFGARKHAHLLSRRVF